jgi:hypothetical protein
MGGLVGGTVFFCLDVRADYAPEEASNIRKYKLGKEVVYSSRAARRHLENASARGDAMDRSDRLRDKAAGMAMGLASIALAKMNLNISIASLGRGHHIECKDLSELMGAEEAVMQACRNVRDFLDLAATFNGSTILVDFVGKDEKVHTAMGGEVYASLPPATSAGMPPPEQEATDAEFEEVPAAANLGAFAPTDMAQLSAYGMGMMGDALWRDVKSVYAQHPEPFWISGGLIAGIAVLALFGITGLAVCVVLSALAFFVRKRLAG